MAIGQYTLWLCDAYGANQSLITEYDRLEYSIVEHGIGALTLRVKKTFDWTALGSPVEDHKIAVYRRAPGKQTSRLENVYLVSGFGRQYDSRGQRLRTIRGVDGNHVLKRRVVWQYSAGSSYIWKNDHGDDIAKALVRDAITAPPWDYRQIPAAQFACDGDLHQGVSFKKNYVSRRVIDAVTAACDTSTGRGGTVLWRVVPETLAQYKFYTHLNQIGTDRRNEITLAVENNNFRSPDEEFETQDEANYVYALGDVKGTYYPEYRYWASSYNDLRYAATPYALRESIVQTSGTFADDIRNAARDYLSKNGPRWTMTGDIADNEGQRYGDQWYFGDLVQAVDDAGGTINYARVSMVNVVLEGYERITVSLKIPPPASYVNG